MNLSPEFILSLIVQLLTIGIFVGSLKATVKSIERRIETLEEKQDKHNGWVERVIVVEQSTKSAHRRIDGLENKIVK